MKNYISKANTLSKLIVTISSFYATFYFIENIIFRFKCEKLYGIPADYFSYNAEHNILVILDVVFVIGLYFYSFFMRTIVN